MIYLKKSLKTKKSNQISSRTYNRLKYTLKIIEKSDLGQMLIQEITAKNIKDFLNDNTNYSESTLKKIYQLLVQTFKRAIERNYIIRNPITFEEAQKRKSNKETSNVEALTIEEEKKLILTLSNETTIYKYIILLMLFTRMRAGEVLALKWSSIKDDYIYVETTLTKDEDGKVILGKTKKLKQKILLGKYKKMIL